MNISLYKFEMLDLHFLQKFKRNQREALAFFSSPSPRFSFSRFTTSSLLFTVMYCRQVKMELNDLKVSSIELGAYPCAFTQWNESIFSSSLSSLASAPFRWIYLSYQKMKLRAKRRINQFTHVQYATILFWTFFTQNAYHLIDFGLCSFTIFRLCVFLLGFFFCTLVSFIIVVHRLFRFEINLIENVVDPVYKYDIFIVVHRFKSNGVFSQVNAVSHLSNILYNIERHFSWIRFLFSAHIEVRSLSMLQRIFIYTHNIITVYIPLHAQGGGKRTCIQLQMDRRWFHIDNLRANFIQLPFQNSLTGFMKDVFPNIFAVVDVSLLIFSPNDSVHFPKAMLTWIQKKCINTLKSSPYCW